LIFPIRSAAGGLTVQYYAVDVDSGTATTLWPIDNVPLGVATYISEDGSEVMVSYNATIPPGSTCKWEFWDLATKTLKKTRVASCAGAQSGFTAAPKLSRAGAR
jgi:hypothetical protein